MVDPDQRSLMIVYDDMQAIYKGRCRMPDSRSAAASEPFI
jgi:hypothetical protein